MVHTSSDRQLGARTIERVLVELLQLERELCELAYVRRADALERAGDAVRALSELGSADGILARAAAELGHRSQFHRVLISELVGDSLQPLALWDGPDESAAARGARSAPDDADPPRLSVDRSRGGSSAQRRGRVRRPSRGRARPS